MPAMATVVWVEWEAWEGWICNERFARRYINPSVTFPPAEASFR